MRQINLRKVQAARLATIRDINRQIVLNYVREREPISRAEIARETALQRSTVSAIIDDLQSEGLVEEIGEGESTGGRPPTMLRLRTVGAIAIGVAVTPSVTTIATSDLAGRVLGQKEFPMSRLLSRKSSIEPWAESQRRPRRSVWALVYRTWSSDSVLRQWWWAAR